MRGVHQTAVEHQIAGNVSVEITVVMTATGAKCLAQCDQILIGTTQRGQTNRLDFEDVAGFPRLLQRATGQRLERVHRIHHRAQITAVALPDFNQPGKRQHAHGFTHGVAADAQFGAQLRLGRQPFADLPHAIGDALAQLIQGLIDQGSLDQR